jgi:hypothetical protein
METVEQEQFETSDLITLSVPLSLPYQTNWVGWEKVRGEITIDGVTYQYVQRKVENGHIVVQCLPNRQQAKIESARDRFFQLANSFQADNSSNNESSNNTVKITKPSLTDFDDYWSCWNVAAFALPTVFHLASGQAFYTSNFPSVQGQPPEWIA